MARALYDRVVEQARAPVFYRDLGVPDTLDGRFDAIVLHATLVIRRLQRAANPLAERGQALFDTLVDDMDRSLREMGAGDLGVAPRVKRMAQGFYGRFDAYGRALDGEGDLCDALARNLYGTVATPDPRALELMAAYVRREAERLDSMPDDAFQGTAQVFGDPPAVGAEVGGAVD
ncbi:ubiquinol-cytochrome C chaperone family protein [Limimonas halophila]|nr:ubiquinol-cytochrome C chaperone family protein [Limimonas halophila]